MHSLIGKLSQLKNHVFDAAIIRTDRGESEIMLNVFRYLRVTRKTLLVFRATRRPAVAGRNFKVPLKTYYSYLKTKNKKRVHDDKIDGGFTFVETLAVLIVTALLASQVGVAVNRIVKKAKVVSAKNQIEAFKLALSTYYVDCGSFPTDEQGLMALWEKPVLSPVPEGWSGPYMDKKVPADPWGAPYSYFRRGSALMPQSVPDGLEYAIVCLGEDGVCGGENDIVSWQE